MRRRTILPTHLVCIVLCALGVAHAVMFADGLTFDWAKKVASEISRGGGYARKVATTSDNGIVLAGQFFRGRITIGPTQLTTPSNWGLYLIKYSANGQPQWVRGVSGKDAGDSLEPTALSVDEFGDTILAAYFGGTAVFPTFEVKSNGTATGADCLIAKYSPSGETKWVINLPGNGNRMVRSIATDLSGTIYVAGTFDDTITFGSSRFSTQGGSGGFLAAYSADGAVKWAQSLDADYVSPNKVSLLGDRLYVCGSFQRKMTFGGVMLTSAGSWDSFVATCTVDGKHLWARRSGSKLGDYGNGIVAYATNCIFVGGSRRYETYINEQWRTSQSIVVERYDGNGDLIWSRESQASESDSSIVGIAADTNGLLYLAGNFRGKLTIGDHSFSSTNSATSRFTTLLVIIFQVKV